MSSSASANDVYPMADLDAGSLEHNVYRLANMQGQGPHNAQLMRMLEGRTHLW